MDGLCISGTSTASSSLPPIFPDKGQQLAKVSKEPSSRGNSKANKRTNNEMAALRDSCEMKDNRAGKLRTPPVSGASPTSMKRAKQWSPDVENAYRFQLAGFRNYDEYLQAFPEPELWLDTGFVKCLQSKTTGFYLYFRCARECEDKHLNKIKIYS